jgi:phosphoribosylaminoimidazole-succinocarboxamide synthase
MSGLSAEGFAEMTEIALDTALALHEIFARQGLELWDGKVEMVESVATKPLVSRILLADSLGPDELRVMHKGKQLSKEMIRQFYRGSNWERSLQEAQRLAKERATLDWKQICIDELKSNPDLLAADFKTQVDRLYGVLANTLMGRQVFSDHPDIEKYSADLDAIMGAKAK